MSTIGKIYKIYSEQYNKVYIGSTTRLLLQRFMQHKRDYRKYNKGNTNFITSFHILQYDDANIELIEEVQFDDKKDLIRRERFHIENSDCVNRKVEGRTRKEYDHDNKERISEQRKQYYEQNKEKRLEQAKEYREQNKEKIYEQITCACGSVVRKDVIRRHKRTKKHQNYLKTIV